MIQIYEGVICRECFKISPFRKVLGKLFALRQKYKDERNHLMQGLVKLIMNSFFWSSNSKVNNEFFKCLSEHWMQTEYDDNVIDYWKLTNGIYLVKLEEDDGLDGDNDVKNTLPSHLGSFNLSHSKRNMNNSIGEIDGFFIVSIFYGDTDSSYFKNIECVKKAKMVETDLCQGENDYGEKKVNF